MPTSLRRLVCLFTVLLFAGRLAAQTSFSSVVVFGDSLSDTGNIANLVQNATAGAIRFPGDFQLPGGISSNYTDGRFTDGKETQPAAQAYLGVWVEQLAASFPAKPPVKDALDGGTNYAYGDATTATSTTTITEGPISIGVHNMGRQVADYLANVASKSAAAPNPQTLFVLWGGANDLYQASTANADLTAAATTAINNELALVQQLAQAGATNFLIPNLPPLGGVPNYATTASATALNAAAAGFAQGLVQGITTLKASLAAQGVMITIYQPDIFSLFGKFATSPMSVGLGDVIDKAQGISGSPDTYLIWDGLHPTTTGHHFAAATAANLLTPLVASTTTLSAPATVLTNQPATVTATVTSSASTKVPTGLVTLFANTTAIASGVLNAGGVATATIPASTVVPGIYNITAVYAGDTTYNVSASPGQPGLVLPSAVMTITSLATSNPSPSTGASVVLTATVTPAVASYGPATGTVTFLNGMATLGTGTLSNGVATFTTTTLPAGTQSITAMYGAAGVFSGSTSAPVTETVVAPTFTASASPTSVTIKSGSSGTTTITAVSAGGYAGVLTLACGTLPAHLSCSFSTTTLTLAATGTANPSATLTIATNAMAALRLPSRPGAWSAPEVFSASLLGPGLASLLLLARRRRRLGLDGLRFGTVLLLLLSAGAAVGLAGCGSSSNNNAAPGTYTVPVNVTPASGTAQVVSLSVTVQ